MGVQEIRFFSKIGFLWTIWVPQNFVKLPILKPSPKSVTISKYYIQERFILQTTFKMVSYQDYGKF
jgi:hypothetical protein